MAAEFREKSTLEPPPRDGALAGDFPRGKTMNRTITRIAIVAGLAALLVTIALRLLVAQKEQECNQRDDNCAVGCP